MKKYIVIFFIVVLCLNLSACGNKSKQSKGSIEGVDSEDINNNFDVINKNQTNDIKISLNELIEKLVKDADVPLSSTEILNKSNFQQYSFIDWQDGIEAICSEGQITTDAHSLVLIKTSSNDAEKIAKKISDQADLAKWICVSAETGKVLYANNYIFMIMSYDKTSEKLTNNFIDIFGEGNVKSFDIKENS